MGWDLLVLALQLVMLGITIDKRKLTAPEGGERSRDKESQDHDAEERGTRSRQEGSEGIELRPLRPASEGRTGGEQDRERNELLEETGRRRRVSIQAMHTIPDNMSLRTSIFSTRFESNGDIPRAPSPGRRCLSQWELRGLQSWLGVGFVSG